MKNIRAIFVFGYFCFHVSINCMANTSGDSYAMYYLCDQAFLIADNGTHYRQSGERMVIKLSLNEIICVSEEEGRFVKVSYPVKASGISSVSNLYFVEEQATKFILNREMKTILISEKLRYKEGKRMNSARLLWNIHPLTKSDFETILEGSEMFVDDIFLNQTQMIIPIFELENSYAISCFDK